MTYYIANGDDHYILDAHEDISTTYSGQVTSHPTARRQNAGDNYRLTNPTARFNGEVTDVVSPFSLNERGAGGYVDDLKELMDKQIPVTFKRTLHGPEEQNWFITSFTASQRKGKGYGGTKEDKTVVQSFSINISLEQVQVSQGAVSFIGVPKANIDGLQVEGKGSSATKELDDTVAGEDEKRFAQRKARELRATSKKAFKASLGIE